MPGGRRLNAPPTKPIASTVAGRTKLRPPPGVPDRPIAHRSPLLVPPPSPCRKKKAVHKTTSSDDKRLQNTLKRLGVNTIPGIEEVLLFNEDSSATAFSNPKVQASIAANTYVISGPSTLKTREEAMMAMMGGMDVQQMLAQMGMAGRGGMGGAGMGGGGDDEEDDDDDDVPELVGNFEEPE